jgi:hypothetical protein
MFNKKTTIATVLVSTLLLVTYSVLLIFKGENLVFWVREDGFFEAGGALMYLLASVILIYLYLKSKSGNDFVFLKTKRNLFFLLLGLLFFLCFGEEISWGQRILNIDTPEFIAEINAQKEINVHNLFLFHGQDENGLRKTGIELWYNLDRLFSLFWILYCLIIPLLDRSVKGVAVFFRTLNLPIVPIWIGSLFLVNYILSKALEKTDLLGSIQPIVEIKEANLGFLFLVIGVDFYLKFRKELSNS